MDREDIAKMKGSIKLEVLAKKDQNYVNGKCDFCGDEFASHILVLRPQKGLVEGATVQEIKFCPRCFRELQKVVAGNIIRELRDLKAEIESFNVN